MVTTKLFKTTSLLCMLAILSACKSGGGGGSTSTIKGYQSPSVSVNQFVNALNGIEGAGSNQSEVEVSSENALRTYAANQDEWFVIWDDKFNEYKAVSLQYVRSIVYYDYHANTSALASEFRYIENSDITNGNLYGDFYGDDYEVVDLNYNTGLFEGRRSGYLYEDEAETKDVSLMTAELQQNEFIKKAANISYAFNVGLETSLSLVTLGEKAELMLGKKGGELTAEDQTAFATDLQRLTGVTLAEVMEASKSQKAQDDLIGKIANKIGTSSSNLENRILPELFGIEL